jgi:hypothetical protein
MKKTTKTVHDFFSKIIVNSNKKVKLTEAVKEVCVVTLKPNSKIELAYFQPPLALHNTCDHKDQKFVLLSDDTRQEVEDAFLLGFVATC